MLFKKNNSSKATLTSQIRISRCSSCGAVLQDDNKNEAGYISPSRLQKHIEEMTCDRCYNLRHYNASSNEFDADYKKIIANAVNCEALIVYVVDLFSFEPSLIPNISQYLGDNVLVILNKRDLLPSSKPDSEILEESKRRLAADHIYPKDIVLFSSYSGLNVQKLFETMNRLRKGKDVYFIGSFLVGKSSIVTEMLRQYRNETDRMITTKQVEGTVLDVMEIPLDEDSSMYDTPGIYNPSSILNQLERDTYKYIIPREEIKPREIVLEQGQYLMFGSIACLGVESNSKLDLVLYASNSLEINKIKKDMLERSFNQIASTMIGKPSSSLIKQLSDLERKEILIPPSGNIKLIIYGLLNLTFKGEGQKIVIYLPKKVNIKVLIN